MKERTIKSAIWVIVGAVTVFVSLPAQATTLIATGTIGSIIAIQNSQSVPVPAGTLRVGDPFTLNATFDLAAAQLTSTFDADPTINIYSLPGTFISLTIGTWTTTFQPTFDFNSSVQLWDDRVVVSPVDAQSFDFFRFHPPAAEVPFDLGPGELGYSIDQNNFDFTATTRTNDLITQMVPLSSFGSHSFSVGFLNASSGLFVQAEGRVDRAELLDDAVPEPSTWMLMLVGFGVVGAAMRRKQRTQVRFAPWRSK